MSDAQLDITPNHLLVRGDHLAPTDYSRVATVADTMERAIDGVRDAAQEAEADRNLTPDGVREKRQAAATAAAELVERAAGGLVDVLEKEASSAGGNPFQLTQIKGVEPSEAGAQRRHAITLFLDQLKAQPEAKRDLWLRNRLLDAASQDRKVMLGAVYEMAAELGEGAYGITAALLGEVQEHHFRTLDPDGAAERDQRRAAAQLVQANRAVALRKLRAMGAAHPEPALV